MELEDLVCPLDASESSAGERLSTVSDVSPTNISHLQLVSINARVS